MTTYLVDYENVNAGGLLGIDSLDATNTVLVFYSQQADTLTFSLHKQLMESRASITLLRVSGSSKNSLDFQLSSYLGYLIARDGQQQYCIISRDNGFGVLVEFWKQQGVSVSVIPALPQKKQAAAPGAAGQPTATVTDKLSELLPQFRDELTVVNEYLQKYKTKQGFNNALTKAFGSEKTGIIYKAVKPLLADMKGK